jgi:hypothetical protein
MPFKTLVSKETEKILEVPYYSEFTEIDGTMEHKDFFKRRSCGIVSVKMVLDYFHNEFGTPKIKLADLIKKSLNHRAYLMKKAGTKENGWLYPGIVRVLQSYGFQAWRRRVFILPFDLNIFKKEGVNKNSLSSYVNQATAEMIFSFKNAIDKKEPIIVSVMKNLGTKKTPHMIVITGYKAKEGRIVGLYVNDPNNPKKAKERPILKNEFISVIDFVKIWRKTAIFIER